jgi:8-oxo-dGTP pyrophosphatase MutT (NUDIX family)
VNRQLANLQEAPLTEAPTTPEPQPVAAAIVTSSRGILAGKRNDGKPPWTFIAGEVEPGESPADAASREVREETGLIVTVSKTIGRRVHPKTGRTMIYLACITTHGTDVHVGDPEELAEVRWLSLAEADELMPGMFEPVREYLGEMTPKNEINPAPYHHPL